MKDLLNNRWVQPLFVFFPLIPSAIFFFAGIPLFLIASFVLLFVLVAFLPVCERRENLWMFVFSSVSLLPANIRFSFLISQWAEEELYWDSAFIKIIIFLIALHILFCMEQIILGVITRFLWRRQYKVEVE